MSRPVVPVFSFINLSHPDELKDADTRLHIRQLAMTEVGKWRRKPNTKRKRNEVVLKFRKPAASLSIIERLGGGEVDPVTSYPIELDATSRYLIAFIFRNNSAHSRQLRGAWYPVGLSDKAAFYNVLSNARLFMLKELTGVYTREDDALSLVYQNSAVRLLREKTDDPRQHDSDQILAAIASFMCHHCILGTFEGWKHHRNAMAKVIHLKGGLEKIEREELRITVSWCDLVGSFAQDIPSIIPLPQKWLADSRSLPGSPRPFSSASLTWKSQFPMTTEWISIFDDISQLIAFDCGLSEVDLSRAATMGCWMEPTMVRLLSLRPLTRGIAPEDIMEEVCRLGTILFLAPIWRSLGASPVWTFNISRNLLTTLLSHMVEWHELKSLLVWVVYFAAIETRDYQERSQYVFMLAVLMGGLQIREWGELMRVVKDVIWVERVFAASDWRVREEVLSILQLLTGSIAPILQESEA